MKADRAGAPPRSFLLLFASGVLLAVAFPPIDFMPAAFVALVPLFYVMRETRATGFWSAFRPGLIAGIAFFLPLLYWLIFLSSNDMDDPVFMTLPLVLLLLLESLYWGLASAGSILVTSRMRLPGWIVVPVFWVACEQLRSLFVLGFTWGALGYAGVGLPRAIQFASGLGLMGVSFWIALVNVLVLELLLPVARGGRAVQDGLAAPDASAQDGAAGRGSSRTPRSAAARLLQGRRAAAIALALVLAVPLVHGTLVMRCGYGERTVRVAVIQPNIEAKKKWDSRFKDTSFDVLGELTRAVAGEDPDLVVWPETAAPSYLLHEPEYFLRVAEAASAAGAPILTGFPDYADAPGTPRGIRTYNSVLLVTPGGAIEGKYDKIHLVPFGEVIPFETVFPALERVDFGEADFTPGEERLVFELPDADTRFSTLICFESIFPRLVREFVDGGAAFLVNVTNDVWYGRSSMPFQHASMAVMRSIENRRSLARSANSGVSLFVDPYGRILAKTEIFTRTSLVLDLPLVEETTFYTRQGDVFAWSVLALAALLVIGSALRRREGSAVGR
jgi:apolipoprotein N-acyltransferase